MNIPKIIHQIWSDKTRSMPSIFQQLAQTWRDCHPGWEYHLWTDVEMSVFVAKYFPQYLERFNTFPYDVQRWDAFRYLILYKIGGVYVDSDYECLENIEPILQDRCCFSMEPPEHNINPKYQGFRFNNALMAVKPENLFMRQVLVRVFEDEYKPEYMDKFREVLCTTGPWMLMELYLLLKDKSIIHLIEAKYVSPYHGDEVRRIAEGEESEDLERKLQDAYAIHYFTGTWMIK